VKSLKFLLSDLLVQHSLDVHDIHAHYEYNKDKTCPNINIGLVRLLVMADYDWVTLSKGEGKKNG
jgi:hypothetical protein